MTITKPNENRPTEHTEYTENKTGEHGGSPLLHHSSFIMHHSKLPGITQDYFFKKKVIIFQNKKGYRFSVDAPILADFLPSLPGEEALEIGTGSGIISLLALYKNKFAKITGVEIQESLFQLALLNAEKNKFSQRFQPVYGDFNRNYRDFTGVKTIFANPPFLETGKGRLSPTEEIRDAKMETRLTLNDLLIKSRAILHESGSVYLILPYYRYNDLITRSRKTGFFPRLIREVFSFKDGKPERFLVQLTT
ncbi:MAG: tRNA1Val (adenine37-N6)-methyltransferase, partial [Acidobacteriota bacterium]|nr:tRNA1Val (adenine37-N6)-methyltransferase [Acidobacteriota bacterium]